MENEMERFLQAALIWKAEKSGLQRKKTGNG